MREEEGKEGGRRKGMIGRRQGEGLREKERVSKGGRGKANITPFIPLQVMWLVWRGSQSLSKLSSKEKGHMQRG